MSLRGATKEDQYVVVGMENASVKSFGAKSSENVNMNKTTRDIRSII
jgi:hypothetical protein